MSLDFIIGLTVFLVAFIFVFSFIPGLFVPFVSNSDELTMTADRTAMMLADDTLALRDSSGIYPGILNATLIANFQNNVTDNAKYRQLRTDLGLNSSESGLYSFQVIIQYQDGTMTNIINSADVVQNVNGNVGQSKRFVYVRDLTLPPSDPNNYPGRMAIMTVRVW